METGFLIRKIRLEKSISQIELSKKTKIPQSTLSDLENGKYLPDIKQIKLIAEALDLPVSELVK